MYVIIGQGRAGTSAANTLRRLDPSTPITVVTAEKDSFYSRIDLPEIVSGKRQPEGSLLQSAEVFRERDITCLMGETVEAVMPERHEVRLQSGQTLAYDKLLLATGSLPVVPRLDGADAAGVHTLWTMADTRRLIEAAGTARAAVVVGAGLIGLKTALALAERGLAVSVVERLPRLMPRQLDGTASDLIAERLAAKGIDLLVDTEVTAIVTDGGTVSGVAVPGRVITADMVLMAVGVAPNVGLARAAGLNVRRGIVVDATQATSAPDIYAAGDAAETIDALTGEPTVPATWPVAEEQGRVAAANMAGGAETFDGSVAMNAVDIAGLALVSVGDIVGDDGDEVLVNQRDGSYRKIVHRDNRLRGVLCLGDIRQAGVLAGLVWKQMEMPITPHMLSPSFGFGDLITT